MTRSRNKKIIALLIAIPLIIYAEVIGFSLLRSVKQEKYENGFALRQELHSAIVKGDTEKAIEILDESPALVNIPLAQNSKEYATTQCDDTPLIAAGSNQKMVLFLLERGADPNICAPVTKRYPITQVLSRYCETRFTVALTYAISGADLTVTDGEVGSVCENFASMPIHKSDEYEIEDEAALYLLIMAIESGGDPYALDGDGESLVYKLISRGYTLPTEYLFDWDVCDPNAPINQEKMTPLMIAIRSGRAELVDFLLSHGADPDVKDANGHDSRVHLMMTGDKELSTEVLALIEKYS